MGKTISSTHVALPTSGGDPLRFADAVGERTRGMDFQREGRHPQALACFERAEALFAKDNDLVQVAWTLQNEGLVLELVGRPEDAIGCFTRAERLFADHADANGADLMYRRRGDVLRRMGRQDEARREYAGALARYDGRHDPNGMINTRCSDAASLLHLRQDHDAKLELHTALTLLRSYHRKAGEYDFLLFARLAEVEQRIGEAKTSAAFRLEASRIIDNAGLRQDRSNPDIVALLPAYQG
jgi:tetratricopeptide (TPR) repeat protein